MPDPNKKKKSSVEGSGKQLVGPTLYGTPENAIAKAAREQYGYAPPVGPGWSAYANQYVGAGGMIPYMSAGYNPYAYFAQPGTRFHPELFNPNQTLPTYPTQSSSPGAFSAYYAPAGVAGNEGQGAGSPTYSPYTGLSQDQWDRMTNSLNRWGYWTGNGLDYGISQQNLANERNTGSPGALNEYGQPIGTLAPYQKKGVRGPGSKGTGEGSQGGSFFGTAIKSRPVNRPQNNNTNTGTGIEGGWFGQLANWRI